jgi:hypothetical protein
LLTLFIHTLSQFSWPGASSSAVLLEQQEKLRRHVDEWRFRSRAALSDLGAGSACPSKPASSALVRLRVDPAGAGAAASLLLTAAAVDDNVAVSKFISVLSHSCIELSRLSNAVLFADTRSILYCDVRLLVLRWNRITLLKFSPSFQL